MYNSISKNIRFDILVKNKLFEVRLWLNINLNHHFNHPLKAQNPLKNIYLL